MQQAVLALKSRALLHLDDGEMKVALAHLDDADDSVQSRTPRCLTP